MLWQPVVVRNMFQCCFGGIWFWIYGICLKMCCLRATSPFKSHVYVCQLVVVFHRCSEISPSQFVSYIICFLSLLSGHVQYTNCSQIQLSFKCCSDLWLHTDPITEFTFKSAWKDLGYFFHQNNTKQVKLCLHFECHNIPLLTIIIWY